MKRWVRSFSTLSTWVLQPLIVLVILVGGFSAASRLSLRREPPPRAERAVYAPLVRIHRVETGPHAIAVRGNGTLEARSRIDLVPQVGGEIVAIHPGLRAGGRFRAGEVLAQIEPRDYELEVARAEAEVSSAETALVTNRAESEVAIEEWDRLNPGEPPPPLVSLEPQIREADARLAAAEATLESARLDLSRTELALPFDGRVVDATVDLGEIVTANQAVGTVYATEVFEVAVPLRVEELVWLDLPGGDSSASTSRAVVRGLGAGGPFEVEGRLARVFGQLDATSRQARVVVEIATAELELETAANLLPGTFVEVAFDGHTLSEVALLPRAAVRTGGVVWAVDEEDQLRFVRPTILHSDDGTVVVDGLTAGDRVVLGNLEVVTPGMRVRVFEEESAP